MAIDAETSTSASTDANTAPAIPPTVGVTPSAEAPSIAQAEAPTQARAQLSKPANATELYQKAKDHWAKDGLPRDQADWISRAREVAETLAVDAVERERANKSPFVEIELLKASGLLKLLGPEKYGGGAQPWSVGYKVIREVAKGDGSIGMLLGYHLLWSTTANVVGSIEQSERAQELIITNNYFVGGAVNPRDSDLVITSEGDEIVYNGFKFFSTGGVISDLTVLEGVLQGTENHIFAIVKTQQPGIIFSHDWDNVGLRLTESGSVKLQNVRAPWSDALGWNVETKEPNTAVLGIPFGSLFLPSIQLVFSNFYLGIAQGALDYASKYTTTKTRAWPYGGDNKEKVTDEFYILALYGNFHAHLRAASTLADSAGDHADQLYAKFEGSLENRAKLTPHDRGEFAEHVAAVKVVTTDTGLRVAAGVFEATGSKATAARVGLDRFWRDIRTHTLHDPVAYKNKELGEYQLLGKHPEPTWYT